MVDCRVVNGGTYSLNDDTSDLVGAGVTGRTAVFEITLAVLGRLAGNTDAATTVGDTVAELVDIPGLMTAGETLLVALSVDGDVFDVTRLQLLHAGLDDLHTALGTHRLRRHVGVKTGSVPLTLDGLGLEGDADTELLGDTVQHKPGHPQLVTHYKTVSQISTMHIVMTKKKTHSRFRHRGQPGTPTGRA